MTKWDHNCNKEAELAILKTNDTFIMKEIQEIKKQWEETNSKIDLVLKEFRETESRIKKRTDDTKAGKYTEKIVIWVTMAVLTWVLGLIFKLL